MDKFLASDSHGFGLVRQIRNASPASRAYCLLASHVRLVTEQSQLFR
jgi:hypothetical protein